MDSIFETYRPSGFGNVNSYLFTEDPELLISFLKNAFHASELNRSVIEESGEVGNCILQIGDSAFMISQSRPPFLDMKTAFYLFVDDVDAMHARAIQYGGVEMFPPDDMDYQDRQSGIIDPSGNYWWISKRLVEQAYS